jgi:hypothetical protein
MKIVKIENPIEGFVYEYGGSYNVLMFGNEFYFKCYYITSKESFETRPFDESECVNLMGKIGITHKLEDGKLVDIPRREIEKGDVFKQKGVGKYFISHIEDYYTSRIYFIKGDAYHSHKKYAPMGIKTNQIMGIHYEIDWSIE